MGGYRLYIVMGVCGCGKSSVAAALSNSLVGTYLEGDAFHPASNIEKMKSGIPLRDEDRWDWLTTIAEQMKTTDGIVFASCSALRKSYREHLVSKAAEPIVFIVLDGTKDLISKRMASREGHYMPSTLLDSQIKLLEYPDESEKSIIVDISGSPEDVIQSTISLLEENNFLPDADNQAMR